MTLTHEYKHFVHGLMSGPTRDTNELLERIRVLQNNGHQTSMLLTAALGLGGEAGEVVDLVKKVVFHGKELDNEIRDKFVKEAGDVLWYIAALCVALDVELDEVFNKNMEKLMSRYPGGKFSIERSENRKE